MQQFLLAAAGYPVIVFPLALIWHLVLFKEKYMAFGYFTGEPKIGLGLLSMVIQGVALGLTYPLFQTGSTEAVRAFQFAGLMGLFFWTSHVLALVAKQQVPAAGTFVAMETVYLVLQFGLYALWLAFLYGGA